MDPFRLSIDYNILIFKRACRGSWMRGCVDVTKTINKDTGKYSNILNNNIY